MSTYKHILVATDFSESSALAAARANELAQSLGAKITILHVVTYVPPGYVAAQLPANLADEETLVDMAKIYLDNWIDQRNMIISERLVLTGSPKKEIVEAAKKLSADLIVIGAHSQVGLESLIGSTANAVIHHAHCDVVTTHPE